MICDPDSTAGGGKPRNRTRKLLVSIQCDTGTRWLADLGELAVNLERKAELLFALYTTGPQPRVTVTVEEKPENPPGR